MHNRYRQDNLWIEKRLTLKIGQFALIYQSFPWLLSMLGWLAYNAFINPHREAEFHRRLFTLFLRKSWLIIAMIVGDEQLNPDHCQMVHHHIKMHASARAVESGSPRAGVLTHLTPLKRLKNSKGEKTTFDTKANVKCAQRRWLGNAATAMTMKNSVPLRNKQWKMVLSQPHYSQSCTPALDETSNEHNVTSSIHLSLVSTCEIGVQYSWLKSQAEVSFWVRLCIQVLQKSQNPMDSWTYW